jgi:hypothetical protein
MALTGTFEADFSAFYSAVDLAKSKLSDMAGVAGSTADELSQILDQDAPEQMHQLAGATDEVTQANQGASVSIGDMIQAYISAEAIIGAVTAAFTALVDVVKESITSASDAEQAQTGLEGALRAQGTAVPSVITAYEDYASALQKTTRYSDDAVVAAEKVLVQIGGVMPRDMQKALKATTDLAAGLGIDLTSAATMVAKAAEGQTTALQKAGVQIETTKGQTASFTTVLDTINAKFGDQATIMAGTYAGALDQTANAWDNLLESIGRTITDNETVRTALAGLNSLITTNTGELNQNAAANQLVSEAVILVARGFSLAVEGIDYFQHELRDARMLTDSVSLGLVHFYELLQKIEIATQTPIALLGGEAAKQRVKEAGDALEWAGGAAQGLRDHMAQADKTSQDWSATLQGFRGNLDQLITQLEATRGQTAATTAAQAEAKDVWDKQTGAISAQQLALEEHAMMMEGAGDKWQTAAFHIDAAATAIVKSMDAAVMAALKAKDATGQTFDENEQRLLEADKTSKAHYDKIANDAAAAYALALNHQDQYTQDALNKLYNAADKAAADALNWADLSKAAMESVAGGAMGTASAIDQISGSLSTAADAWTSYADNAMAAMQLTSDYINYAYMSPGSVAKGTLGQSFFVDPSTGAIQPRASGGPVSAGSSYLVGERGPELFVPGASGSILPSAGGVVVQPGAIVMNYPIVNNPQALDQLARTVGDAILTKLTRAGARL